MNALLLIVAIVLPAAPTDDEKPLVDEKNAQIHEKLADTNKTCGTSLTAAVDWESYLPAMRAAQKSGMSLRDAGNMAAGGCGLALDALASVCGAANKEFGKAAVQALKAVSCRHAPSDNVAGIAMSLDGTTLVAKGSLSLMDDETGMRLEKILVAPPDDAFTAPATVFERRLAHEMLGDRLKEASDLAARRCGQAIPVTVDWAALLPHFREVHKDNVKQAVFSSIEGCISTLEVMSTICHHGKLAKAVASGKVKSLRCSLLEKGAAKRKVELSLKDGVLTTKMNGASANFDEQARAFLEKQ